LKDNITAKNEYIQHIKDNVLTCDLVIWDDIGTKNSTSFESENLLSMIEGRILNNKANIFTSNLNDQELHDALGDRLASRICNLGYNITFNGGDKRGLK
jgi:DNA replication protein DnaC